MPPIRRNDTKATRQIRISAVQREWDPLFAYADSMGITPNQAAAELLLASLTNNATNSTFIAAARRSRYEIQKIMIAEAIKSVGAMWTRVVERAAELGIDIEDPITSPRPKI